ncbi:AP-1-like transcription factor [Cytospora mali]|uniref:AP-1-like transcription factor n=1 Tax=Cytospora mali TaxID=578113 RepID=A0A194UPQ0_CYTMA|nr:AP-1-like transcription factor [Valsa mali var. pyri (nom. inval.)]
MSSDLAILSAEQYGGTAFHTKTGKTKEFRSDHRDDWPRKRTKTSLVTVVTEVAEDGEEEKKRARGRPRLDTKDQTAAERRRTQIRLAQRAYRSRKESAIQSLERKVQDLQETNEEMSNAFMKLHDFAVSLGMLEKAPEFARELRATTEKFLSLARKSSEDGGHDGRSESSSHDAARSPRHGRKEKSSSPEAIVTQPPRQQDVLPWGGYISTTAPVISPPVSVPDHSNIMPTSTQALLDYEIITMPTTENASFPFGLTQNSLFPDIFEHTTLPPSYPLSPFSALPLPNSLAATENTFGRRLQRTATERGYQLITMANPPKERFAKVFGFCMLFEPLDRIRDRLRSALDRTKAESLNNWQTPFWALGGAGQHHIQQDPNQGLVGNQGTTDQFKHSFPGGNFGLGPFDSRTGEIWDKNIDPRMRITLPGFQGDFYDAEEVELYLQSRGVSIQPGQDYLTALIDVAAFEGGGPRGQKSTPFDDWPQNIDDAFGLHPSSTPPSLSPGTGSGTDSSSLGMSDMPNSNNAWPVHDSRSSGMGALGSQFQGFFTGGASAPGGLGDDRSTMAFAGMSTRSNMTPENRKRLVTLDVNAFIKEMVARAVCLGRSPGFRPKDVNDAFWIATKSDGVLGF